MNKVKYLPLIILCMLLTGCGNKNNISKEVPTETAVHTSEVELKTAVETESESTSESDTKTVAEESSETDMKTETALLPILTPKIRLLRQNTLPSTCPQPERHIPPVMPPLLLI